MGAGGDGCTNSPAEFWGHGCDVLLWDRRNTVNTCYPPFWLSQIGVGIVLKLLSEKEREEGEASKEG